MKLFPILLGFTVNHKPYKRSISQYLKNMNINYSEENENSSEKKSYLLLAVVLGSRL